MQKIWLPLLGFLFLIACSPNLSPFTKQIYKENYFTKSELKRIQFYTSERITLTRELRGTKTNIEEGDIIIETGAKIQKIVIPKGTPGVYMFSADNDRIAISFDAKGDRFLMFGPNPKYRGRYTLLASDWKRDRGLVTYGGTKYWADRVSAQATLMVDIRRLGRYEQDRTVESGRKVN